MLIISAAAVATAWLSMGLPVPASTSYVVSQVRPISEDLNSLTLIVLQGRKGRLIEELVSLKEEEAKDPNRLRRQLISIKEREVDAIQTQIDELEEESR